MLSSVKFLFFISLMYCQPTLKVDLLGTHAPNILARQRMLSCLKKYDKIVKTNKHMEILILSFGTMGLLNAFLLLITK